MTEPQPKPHSGVHYAHYLQLDKLLELIQPESDRRTDAVGAERSAHEEHFFILIHQVYELWFKQILWELDSVTRIFGEPVVDERLMLLVINRLTRVVEILKIMVDQIRVIETMEPQDFMSFRNLLVPASGFQSIQFRKIENLMGLRPEQRTSYQQQHYKAYFLPKDLAQLEESEARTSLLQVVEKWLERTPGLALDGFVFMDEYTKAVKKMLDDQRTLVKERKDMDDREREVMLGAADKSDELFQTLLDKTTYEKMREEGNFRLSHLAMQGALMINVYRQEPRFHLPYQMLKLLIDIDSLMIRWRYEHMQMVALMIGNKIGTGGSAGQAYLRATVSDRYKVFRDLANMPTFLVPRTYAPALPKKLQETLNYNL